MKAIGTRGLVALAPATTVLCVAMSAPAGVAGPPHFPQTSKVTLPANGFASVQTGTLPANATQATVEVTPDSLAAAQEFDELATTIVQSFPSLRRLNTRSKRILTCVFMTAGTKIRTASGDKLVLADPVTQLLYLELCLQIALRLPVTNATASAAGCGLVRASIAPTFSRSGKVYRAEYSGTPKRAKRPSPLTVTCRRVGNKLRITARPRQRGRKLRAIVGPRLTFGYANRSDKPVPVRAKIAVR